MVKLLWSLLPSASEEGLVFPHGSLQIAHDSIGAYPLSMRISLPC